MHIAKNNFAPTKGCIALRRKDIKKIAREVNKKTLIKII